MLAALATCDPVNGEVPGGIHGLARCLGVTRRSALRTGRRAAADGYLSVVVTPASTRIWVRVLPLLAAGRGRCCRCGVAGNRYCARCKQGLTRRDRAWRDVAVRMAVAGESPYAIHAATGAPLFRARNDGHGHDGAIVPMLHELGLLDEAWAARARRLARGHDETDE